VAVVVPFLMDQNAQTLKSAVEGVKEDLCKRCQYGCACVSLRAIDQAVGTTMMDFLRNQTAKIKVCFDLSHPF